MKTLTTKYIPATNSKSSRIKVTDFDGFSKIYPYDHSAQCPHVSALKLAKKEWLNGSCSLMPMVVGGTKNGKVAVFVIDEQI